MSGNKAKVMTLIIAVVLLLQGCGLKFWYNRLDWVVPWYVDDYIELTDAQESELEKLMVLKTRWHRTSELPAYVSFLNGIKQDIKQREVVVNYEQRRQQIREFYERILAEMSPQLTELMLTMTKPQLESFVAALKENDQEWSEEVEERSDEDVIERRIENLTDNINEWSGRLTKEQKKLVEKWASELKSTGEMRLKYREQWRSALQQAFLLEDVAKRKTEFTKLIVEGQSLQSEELIQAYQHNAEVAERYLGLLADTMTPKQEKKLLARIDNYIEDFEDLIAEEKE
ncbi:MAG: hypothetical protein HWE27_16790 [Gammaproteobacteria bacterium]|nr:hypothetical protein [Gammaproteobacteria bacterium]